MTSSGVIATPSDHRAFGIDRELGPGAVRIGLDRLRDQPVHGERLVARPLHQRFIDEIAIVQVDDAARGRAHAGQNERIETVERAAHPVGDRSALRRIGIGIGKMGVVGGQSRLAVHGDAVHRLGARIRRHDGRDQREKSEPAADPKAHMRFSMCWHRADSETNTGIGRIQHRAGNSSQSPRGAGIDCVACVSHRAKRLVMV